MDTIAMYFLKLGEHYLEEDHFKAYGFLEEAANMGNCKAAMLLGKYYEMAEKKGDKRAKKKMSSKGVKNLRDAIREILHM